jgi:hypothetical protein
VVFKGGLIARPEGWGTVHVQFNVCSAPLVVVESERSGQQLPIGSCRDCTPLYKPRFGGVQRVHR